MTPIIGLLIAVVTGFVAATRRGALTGVILPMLGVTAAQSWYLGTGRGHNPPATTTNSPAYWVVQLIILALIAGVASAIYTVRARRARRHGGRLVPVSRRASGLDAGRGYGGRARGHAGADVRDGPAQPSGQRQRNLPVTGVVGHRDRAPSAGRVRGAVAAEPAGPLAYADVHELACASAQRGQSTGDEGGAS